MTFINLNTSQFKHINQGLETIGQIYILPIIMFH